MPCTTEPECLKAFARYWNEAEQELFVMRPMEHYERWKQNGGILRIDVPLSPEELCDITAELARRNKLHTDLYIRPLAYKCAERIGVAIDDQDAFFIAVLPYRRISAQRERAACRRQLLAAHRRQCDPCARQNLRRLRQQRAGQR